MNEDLTKDIQKEKEFLANILKMEVGEVENKIGVSSELSLMLKTYNTALNKMVDLRFDNQILDSMSIAEPDNKTYLDGKSKVSSALAYHRQAVRIMRDQINDMLKGMEAKK